MIINLLGGVLIGAAVFAAALFSAYQAVIRRGALRWAHLAALVLTLIGAATISLAAPFTAMLAGISLAFSGVAAFLLEVRWNKVLPLFQILFAVALILGLPFVTR